MVRFLKFILLFAIFFTSLTNATPIISLSSDKFYPGDPVKIKVTNLPGNTQDWITLVSVNAPASKYGEWTYTKGVAQGTWTFTAPQKPGDYEVRVFFDFPAGGETIHARAAVRVTEQNQESLTTAEGVNETAGNAGNDQPEIRLSTKIIPAGSHLKVEVSNLPGNPQDWVTFVRADATAQTYGTWWEYTKGVSTWRGTFMTPLSPGYYEVRVFYDYPDGGMLIRARKQVQVIAADTNQAQAIPEEAQHRCAPRELGTAYDTNQGRLYCQITEVGMDCRAADTELEACGRVMNLTFEGVSVLDDEGRTLVGDVFENGTVGSARMLLNSECNIYSGSWRQPNGRFVHLEATPVADPKPLAAPVTADNSCTVVNLGKHYWSSFGEYECRVVGARLKCCRLGSHPSQMDCSRTQAMNLGLSKNNQEVVGELITDRRYDAVVIAVDERCNLTGGIISSCGAPRAERELGMLFDPRRAPLDQSKPEVQHHIGMFYLQIKRPVDALPHLSTAAEKGHADAQFQLAVLLENAAGEPEKGRDRRIEQDVARATELYASAAAQGHQQAKASLERRRAQRAQFDAIIKGATQGDAEAQYRVSLFYRSGKLVTYDAEQFLFWSEKAAQQEHPAALLDVGSVYHLQPHDERERALGLSYIERSAELGNPYAYIKLGTIAFSKNRKYKDNLTFYANYKEARKWLQLAIASTNEWAAARAKKQLAYYEEARDEHDYREWLKSPAGKRAQARWAQELEQMQNQQRIAQDNANLGLPYP